MSTLSPTAKSLLLPKEHGSWSLAFEPVVLALLVAPSRAGAAVAVAVAAGFFTRRPLKLALTLPVGDTRRIPAAHWALLLATLATTALVGAAALGSWLMLWPLLLAAPFGATFLWFDLRNAMREAEAELAGSIAFALTPAAFATLAGWPAAAALSLAAISLVRNVPTVLTVRTYLRLGKGQLTACGPAIVTAAGGAAGLAALAAFGWVPWLAAGLAGVLLARTVFLLAGRRLSWSARHIGQLEAGLGVLGLGLVAGAYWAA